MDKTTSFRTEIHIPPAPDKLHLQSQVLTAGSCFAEVMGNKMAGYKVKSLVNPFGTIFNPLSLFKLLAVTPGNKFTGELLERDGQWYAYDLHSSFSAPTRDLLEAKIKEKLDQTRDFILKADTLILTLGTAVGYIHKATATLVANCHKVPQAQFQKQLLSTTAISEAFSPLYDQLRQLNPDLKVILTVSPVRHVKETLEVNSVSKSILRVACHELQAQFSTVTYFPAYELMLDDLRDYRFYKADMLHPTEVAEAYIWQKFKDAYFDADFDKFTQEWDKVQQALAHKPFQPESGGHQKFLQQLLSKLQQLHTQTDCSLELEKVKNQLR